MKQKVLAVVDILLYLIIYLCMQGLCMGIFSAFFKSDMGMALTLTQVVSATVTIAIFYFMHWSPLLDTFYCRKPALFYSALIVLTLASIIPSQWFIELSEADVPKEFEALFKALFEEPIGLFAIAVLVPICEEVVFRGAILGRLLKLFGTKKAWGAIVISALIFGLAHGNLAQSPHAFALGILFGWLYYRTDSLIPSAIMHVLNNSTAVLMECMMPDKDTDKLIDIFNGNSQLMYISIAASIAIAIPALWVLIKETPPASPQPSPKERE